MYLTAIDTTSLSVIFLLTILPSTSVSSAILDPSIRQNLSTTHTGIDKCVNVAKKPA